jgi:hypothetical protein
MKTYLFYEKINLNLMREEKKIFVNKKDDEKEMEY